jgi:hypothetical protein
VSKPQLQVLAKEGTGERRERAARQAGRSPRRDELSQVQPSTYRGSIRRHRGSLGDVSSLSGGVAGNRSSIASGSASIGGDRLVELPG